MLECQNEGSGEGSGGHFYVLSLLHVLEHSEHFCFCLLFWWEKLIIFMDGGYPPSPPFAENSAKIINLIFEPFPNIQQKTIDTIQALAELCILSGTRMVTGTYYIPSKVLMMGP